MCVVLRRGLPDDCAVFVFKQKTAYEMRISDWSSDVCSSDLLREAVELRSVLADAALEVARRHGRIVARPPPLQQHTCKWHLVGQSLLSPQTKIGRASCRERVCQYV